jgi:drug/metabolite transporter (DMT)-like permease
MLCFAANSLLCRLALAPDLIDPASFTMVRVLAAAAILAAVVWLRRRHLPRLAHASLLSLVTLFGYLIFFSFAYARLSAGTGALILFGVVQLTMFIVALREGEHFPLLSWAGLALAVAGLVYLVLPGVTAPDPIGAVFMAISGASWGAFSLLARGAEHPVEANAINFAGCIPFAFACLLLPGALHATPAGINLAVASGALASGGGYVVWYVALRGLSATQAATVQLSVPAIAALGGVGLLNEPLTPRLLIASVTVLGGVAIVLAQRSARRSS